MFVVFSVSFVALFLLGYNQLEKRGDFEADLSSTSVIVPDATSIRVLMRHERWGMFYMAWALFTLVGIITSIDNVYQTWELFLGTVLVGISTASMFTHRLYLQDRAYRSHPVTFLIDLAIPMLVLGLGLVRLAQKYYFS